MHWSKYQNDVFDFLGKPENGFINAVAGSGKTTVIEECNHRINSDFNILDVAFNRHIRDELKKRMSACPNITVDTLNGFGYKALRKAVKRYVKLKEEKTQDTLYYDVFDGAKEKPARDLYYRIRYSVCKVVGLCKANMFWTPTDEQIEGLVENWPRDVTVATFCEYVRVTLAKCLSKTLVIDWDDQVALPIYYDWDIPQYDYVFVDEAQDLSPVQIELTKRAIRSKAIYVGDPRQAIYQFRGADSKAVQNIIDSLQCVELPLSICYRCSKAVVRRAQEKVPHIQAAPDAVEGIDADIKYPEFQKMVQDGDVVLCRCTAPLISECLKLIGQGKKAVVKGRDFGEGLLELLPDADVLVESFSDELDQWYNTATESCRRQKKDSVNIQDKYDSLRALFAICKTTGAIRKQINSIFTDTVKGITFMTGHKSKGLEADRIFILKPELLPHPKATNIEAEDNLWYVMVTRAKRDLYWIKD